MGKLNMSKPTDTSVHPIWINPIKCHQRHSGDRAQYKIGSIGTKTFGSRPDELPVIGLRGAIGRGIN